MSEPWRTWFREYEDYWSPLRCLPPSSTPWLQDWGADVVVLVSWPSPDGENLCRASYEPVFLATSSSRSLHGLNGAAKKQGSVLCSGTTGGRILWWPPGFLVPGVHIPLLSYSEDNNLGIGVKGFCRYSSSPNSADLKLGRIFRWAWHNDVSP